MTDVNRVNTWLRENQHVAGWSMLMVSLGILYKITELV